jgi:hypothetical protein
VAQYFPGFDVAGAGLSLPSAPAPTTSAPLSSPIYTSPAQVLNALQSGALNQFTVGNAVQQVAQAGLPITSASQVLNGLQSGVLNQSNVGGALNQVAQSNLPQTGGITNLAPLSLGGMAMDQGIVNAPNSAPTPFSSPLAPGVINDPNEAFNKTYNAIQYGNTKIGTIDVPDQETGSTSQRLGLMDANGNPLPPDAVIPLGNNVYEIKVGYAGGADHIVVVADPKTGIVTPVTDYKQQVGYTGGEKGGALGAMARQLGPIPSLVAVATGNAELVPMINAGTAAVEGKNIGDIGKAYVLGTAAQNLAPLAGDFASGATGSSTLGGAVQNLASSEISSGGKADPLKAFVSGGISSAIPAVASQIDGYSDLTKAQQAMVNNAIAGTLSGQPASQIAINMAVATAKATVQDLKNAQAEQDAIDKGLNEKPVTSGATTGVTVRPVSTSKVTGTPLAPTVDNTGITGDQSLANAYTNTGAVVTGEGAQRATNDYTAQGSFGDAFKTARDQLGPNATFTYNGKSYTTATAPTTPVSEWDTNAGQKAGMGNYGQPTTTLSARDQLVQSLGGWDAITDPFTGKLTVTLPSEDSLKGSDVTNVANVIKAGAGQAGSDIAGLGVRGAQLLGSTLGFDTSGLNQVQNLLQNSATTGMNKLVGQEKNVAGAIASTIESVGSAMVGGPLVAVPAMGAIVANNSWVEGANAGLNNTQNAIRTTLMSSAEMLGEAIGVPGMSKILKSIPTTASASDIISTVKNLVGAQANEQLAEQITTAMQMGVDKIKGIGLNQNATLSDYLQAVKDTAVQTMLTVGGAHAMVGGANAIGQGGSNYVATGDQANTPVTAPSISNVANVAKVTGGTSANDMGQNVVNIAPSSVNQAPTSGALALAPSFNPNVDIETRIDPETQVKTETQVDPDTKVQTEVKTDPNTQIQTQTVINPQTNIRTETVTNPNTKINTQTVVNEKTNVTEQTKTNTQTQEQTKVITDPNANTKTEIVTNPATNTTTTTVTDLTTGKVIDTPTVVVNPPVVTDPRIPTPPEPPVVVEPPPPSVEVKPPVVTKTTTKTPTTTGALPVNMPTNFGGHTPNPIVESLLKTYMTKKGFQDPLAKLEAMAKVSLQSENSMIDPRLAQLLQERMAPKQTNYYNYGQEPQSVEDVLSLKDMAQAYKTGGHVQPLAYATGGALPVVEGRHDFRHGAHVAGEGDGTSDDIPAMLADGEFVFPADVVSALGNGSTKAGTDKLYEMMHSIRARARKAHPSDLAPDALKSPLDYLKGRKK